MAFLPTDETKGNALQRLYHVTLSRIGEVVELLDCTMYIPLRQIYSYSCVFAVGESEREREDRGRREGERTVRGGRHSLARIHVFPGICTVRARASTTKILMVRAVHIPGNTCRRNLPTVEIRPPLIVPDQLNIKSGIRLCTYHYQTLTVMTRLELRRENAAVKYEVRYL